MNKITREHLVWGKDFVLTYGPLSYLSTRVAWGISKYHFILFDLFLWLNFFYIFYVSYVKSQDKKVSAALIIFASLLMPAYFGSGTSLVFLAFLVFWIRQGMEKGRWYFYMMQVLIILLLFFIKFNTGLVSFVFFLVSIGYKCIFTQDKKPALIAWAALPFIGVLILSKLLNVELAGYLKGGLNMVSGHNEIMYLNQDFANELNASIVIMVLALGILLFRAWSEKTTRPKNMVVLFMFSASAYILYKQAFVRADIQHIMEFYQYILLFILCTQDLYYTPDGRNSNIALAFILFIAFFFAKKRDDNLFRFPERLTKTEYLAGIARFTDSAGVHLFPNNNPLPAAIKEMIGNSSVDIYPWNSHLLFENKLNYTPRPAFQSYLAYTPWLENLNFEFYSSPKAPAFMLYEYDAIDERYPLFDEPKVNLTLLENYSCVDTFRFAGRPVLVLQKKPGATPIRFQKLSEYEINIKEALVPKANRYYEVFVSYTLAGKLTSVIDHAPELRLAITTTDGNWHEYRTSKKLLETGLFSDHFFGSTGDIQATLKQDSTGTAPTVTGYLLRPKHPSQFNETVRVIEYSIN